MRNTSSLPNLILKNLEDSGQDIRKAYQRRLPSNPARDYYFMHRDTGDTQSLIIEYGFLDNASDASKLKNNWQSYTDAVVDAVLEYLGITSAGESYTVKSGDSLWSIAKKTGVSVEELKNANNLTGNLLSVGQILKIPKLQVEEDENYIVYTVQGGDSLYAIANKYGVSVNQLLNYNNLSSPNLSIGQQILIPVEEEQNTSNTYTVQSGDTLYKIASRFNTSVTEIMSLNNLKTSILSIGQVLKIPTEQTEDTIINDGTIEYIVKSGDSLYAIASKYGVTVNQIKELNNLLSNNLSIGQVLKIPSSNISTYVVKSGDNLYSIANRFNTTVDSIKKKNGLSSNNLNIGQVLII